MGKKALNEILRTLPIDDNFRIDGTLGTACPRVRLGVSWYLALLGRFLNKPLAAKYCIWQQAVNNIGLTNIYIWLAVVLQDQCGERSALSYPSNQASQLATRNVAVDGGRYERQTVM